MSARATKITEVVIVAAFVVAITVVVALAAHTTTHHRTLRITPTQQKAISQGELAQRQALQSLRNDLNQAAQPPVDYGSGPGCTVNGCVATLVP